MPATMTEVLADNAGKFKKGPKGEKISMEDVEISAWLKPHMEIDRGQLREEEKHLQRERKMLSDILKRWNPTLVGEKAKKKFAEDMKRVDKQLKDIRRKLKGTTDADAKSRRSAG